MKEVKDSKKEGVVKKVIYNLYFIEIMGSIL